MAGLEKVPFVHIAYFGAFDLISFGDTMFPVIFRLEMEKRFGNHVKIDLFAPSGTRQPYNQLTEITALDELPEKHKEQPYDALVIGGGELVHFQPIHYSMADGTKRMYPAGELWLKPGRLAKKLGIMVIWNCVGVSSDLLHGSEVAAMREICGSLHYLSVRDEYSRLRLEQGAGVEGVCKVPDMLWLLRRHFQPELLRKKRQQLEKEYRFCNGDYLVLQYGTSMEYRKLAALVSEVCRDYGLHAVLLAINGCHEDQNASEKIWQADRQFHTFDRLLQPEEIMAVIAGAKFFVGTSLHGNIAAMSYGVKNLCLDMYPSCVSKTDGLFEMLHREERLVYSLSSFRVQFDQLAGSEKDSMRICQEYGFDKQLDGHFNKIADLIQNHGSRQCRLSNQYLSGFQLIKSVLRNGTCSSCSVGIRKGYRAFSLVFQLKTMDRRYEGVFYAAGPFTVEKIQVWENGLPVTVKLEVENGKEKTPLLCKGRCRFFILSKAEPGSASVIEACIQMQDAAEMYMDRLEQSLTRERQEKLNRQGHIDQLLQSERKLQQELANKRGHIDQLLRSERELKLLKATRTWRLAAGMQRLSLAVAPSGSVRRLFFKIGVRLLQHPRQSARMLSPRKIRHFFQFLREEGPGFVSKRMDESMQGTLVAQMKLITDIQVAKKNFQEYKPLYFEKIKNPQVSIVIPVFNQFAYTYACLKSILEHTKDAVAYEVIIADDCSTDDTVRIKELVHNVRVIRNQKNLKFLKNCNHAAESARGRYLVFLNNDTQVQEHWLEPLTELLDEHETAGMAGARLVYADGRLQEAGGIIWEDGSAWNYGNGSDPQAPEYNYVKEVDYLSGAAIIVRTSLWKEIGGFDERFAPAYYEDTDLACEVRKRGYQVLYQPLSVVVHFEGQSNGTDISKGQKSYQAVNQKKFYEKWKGVLTEGHFRNGTNVFAARDRSAYKKKLLVIDHYVPTYDKDAGSRCMLDYLRLFTTMGYQVKFIGDNFSKQEPYTTILQQMGIEVLYGDYYYNHWREWIRANGTYFDYVLLSRPHISTKYIDLIRANSHAKIIYFGHDLHYLREYRAYKLTGSQKALKDAKEWKKTELELMRKADISYYLSQAELDEIAKTDVSLRVRRVPIHIYRNMPAICYRAHERAGILFVGGFGHPPNTDAVYWLGKEIMPLVWKQQPDLVLHVAGANPPKEIQAFDSDTMKIHGFLTDQELEEMYRTVRLAVVPLRYGAGVKGKIIEGMVRGIPIITTKIGAEGIEGARGILKIGKDAAGLAEEMIRLYQDTTQLERMSREGRLYTERHFSMEHAVTILREDFEFDEYEIPE
ncbi:MAG: glycosyltransferase [Eubacterium sp.]|nr:glycosyltransferase [Eubacterium sp.]